MPAPDPSLSDRLGEERILLTGATGFLGLAVLEKLLRSTPEGEPIHLLLRAHSRDEARRRIQRDILGTDAFRALRAHRDDRSLHRRLIPVAGDITRRRLGLDEATRRALANDVTGIIHCAAACTFDQPLGPALETNTLGTRRLLRLADEAGAVPLVHVSTAFVGGTRCDVLPERVPETAPAGLADSTDSSGAADLESRVRALVEEWRRDEEAGEHGLNGRKAGRAADAWIQKAGWENNYTFSKALAEILLLQEHGDTPIHILRPSIIEAAAWEPFPGWSSRPQALSTVFMALVRGGLPAIPRDPDSLLDCVPVDLVANAALAALPRALDRRGFEVVHLAAGPDHLPDLPVLAEKAIEILSGHPSVPEAFTLHRPETLFLSPNEVDEILSGQIREAKRQAEGDISTVPRTARRRAALEGRILTRVRGMMRLYAPFLRGAPGLTRGGLDALASSLSPVDGERFPVDPYEMDWDRYLRESFVPGLIRSLESVPGASRPTVREPT